MTDFFFSKDRVFKPGPLRGVYFLLFAAFFVLTELGREIYRPYIYLNGIDDLGFADVIGNLFGTVAIIFFNLGVSHANRQQGIRLVAFVTAGVIIYELLQGAPLRGVFDWKDVLATLLAGLFAWVLLLVICRRVRDPLSPGQPRRK